MVSGRPAFRAAEFVFFRPPLAQSGDFVFFAVPERQDAFAFAPHLDALVVIGLPQDALGLSAGVVGAVQIHAAPDRRVPAVVVDEVDVHLHSNSP